MVCKHFCVTLPLQLPPQTPGHKFRRRNKKQHQGTETKPRKGGEGCWFLTRKSTRDCRSQPWGTPTKKVIKNKVVTEQSKKNNRGKNRLIKYHHCFYCISGWLSVYSWSPTAKQPFHKKEWPRDHPSSNLTLGKESEACFSGSLLHYSASVRDVTAILAI